MGKQNSKLKPEVIADLEFNTEFSAEELQDWYKEFLRDCPKGKLTKEDYKKIFLQFFPFGDADRFVGHMFRTFDLNHDGVLDFREFVCSLSLRTRATLEKHLQWAFAMYDLDGNGHITKEEMTELIGSIFKLNEQERIGLVDKLTPEMCTEKIFKQVDKNTDGKLSLSEFMEGAKSNPCIQSILKCETLMYSQRKELEAM